MCAVLRNTGSCTGAHGHAQQLLNEREAAAESENAAETRLLLNRATAAETWLPKRDCQSETAEARLLKPDC